MTLPRKNFLLSACLLLVLAGCGGSTTSGDGTPGGGPGGDPGGPPQSTVQIGSFAGNNSFNQGQIAASVTSLMAGQSSTLTVNLVDANQNPVTDAVDVTFRSPCVNSGISEIRIGDADAQTVTNSSGTIEVSYTARGCDGNDPVTASTNINGTTLSANVTLQTQQAPVSSIQFISATPQTIGIQGSGALPEQSLLTFQVLNSTGGPVTNQTVDFSLNTTVGGITLSNAQDTTDGQGRASTTVNSGTIPTTVRVTAQTIQNSVMRTTQSSGLAITTGIADNDSFTLGLVCPNIEGDDINGNTTQVTVLAADRFNNPVPDNTSITYTTEGGAVGGSCLTQGGGCSVTFTTQNPRNDRHRYTLLASATGEESFNDSDGDGRFDDGETFFDLPEAFRDDNENGIRDAGEFFIDFNNNGSYDAASGDYNGLLCDGPTQCATMSTINVRRSQVVVMSGSNAVIDIAPSSVTLGPGTGSQLVTITFGDDADQQLAPGTTVSVTTDVGQINGPSNFTQPCSTADNPNSFSVSVARQGDEADSGLLRVEVTVPSGLITRANIAISQPDATP